LYRHGWKTLSNVLWLRTGPQALEWISIDRQEGGVEMQIHVKRDLWLRTVLAAAGLAGVLALIGAPAVRPDEGACQRRIAKADHRLHEAVEHHGWQSRQATNARQQLHEAREYCWSHARKWWDEDGHRWHIMTAIMVTIIGKP
jgi:hypothetical protein